MKVILFDRKQLVITKAQYQRLWPELQKGDKSDFIKINGIPYRKSTIAYFEEGGVTEADVIQRPIEGSKLLRADSRTAEQVYQAGRKRFEQMRKIIAKKGMKGLKNGR